MLQLMAERVEPIEHPMPAQVAEYRRDDHYGEGRRQEARKDQAHEGKREREAHHFAGGNAEVERNGGHYRMYAGELPCVVQEATEAEPAERTEGSADGPANTHARGNSPAYIL